METVTLSLKRYHKLLKYKRNWNESNELKNYSIIVIKGSWYEKTIYTDSDAVKAISLELQKAHKNHEIIHNLYNGLLKELDNANLNMWQKFTKFVKLKSYEN